MNFPPPYSYPPRPYARPSFSRPSQRELKTPLQSLPDRVRLRWEFEAARIIREDDRRRQQIGGRS